jgi:hypothetical protein
MVADASHLDGCQPVRRRDPESLGGPLPATSPSESAMKLDKQQIMGFLQDKGEDQKAQQADRELPQQVDTEKPEHANLLQKLGIDPMALAKPFMKDKGIPGL